MVNPFPLTYEQTAKKGDNGSTANAARSRPLKAQFSYEFTSRPRSRSNTERRREVVTQRICVQKPKTTINKNESLHSMCVTYPLSIARISNCIHVTIETRRDHSVDVEQFGTACVIYANIAIVTTWCKQISFRRVDRYRTHRGRMWCKEAWRPNLFHVHRTSGSTLGHINIIILRKIGFKRWPVFWSIWGIWNWRKRWENEIRTDYKVTLQERCVFEVKNLNVQNLKGKKGN